MKDEKRMDCDGPHLLASKLHLDIGVHQVSTLPDERLLDVGHDVGVHLRQAFGPVDLHVEPGPLSLHRHPLW